MLDLTEPALERLKLGWVKLNGTEILEFVQSHLA